MNSISFTPNYSVQNYRLTNKSSRPAFTGVPKAPTAVQLKKAGGVVDKLYKLFFLPLGDKMIAKTSDSVVTRAVDGVKVTTKKFPKWSRKPSVIAEENVNTKVKNTYKMHKDGKFDLEVSDTNTPGYKIAVEYKNLSEKEVSKFNYEGGLDLTYCDKKVSVSPSEREALINEFDKSISDKYDEDIYGLLHKTSKFSFEELADKYYKDPEVIGRAVLGSPESVNNQLKTVSGSLPYGIEFIMNKLGK